MRIKIVLILGVLFLSAAINPGLIFSQDTIVGGAIPQYKTDESDMQWLWGEVVNVDKQSNLITVRYLDYETDSEKEMGIALTAETAYENIKSIDELKPQDTVSIDYVTGIDGRNTAKNISVEKPENTPEIKLNDNEIVPEDLGPSS